MCNNCFDTEISSFPTENGWIEFDLELTKKLVAKKMRHVKANPDGVNIYECNSCNEIWKLSDPDYSYRGYFLKTR